MNSEKAGQMPLGEEFWIEDISLQIQSSAGIMRKMCSAHGLQSVVDKPGASLESIALFCSACSLAYLMGSKTTLDPRELMVQALSRLTQGLERFSVVQEIPGQGKEVLSCLQLFRRLGLTDAAHLGIELAFLRTNERIELTAESLISYVMGRHWRLYYNLLDEFDRGVEAGVICCGLDLEFQDRVRCKVPYNFSLHMTGGSGLVTEERIKIMHQRFGITEQPE